jgi:hypothetical protein
MSGLLVAQIAPGNYVVPNQPPAELAHADYFEAFDGLEPLEGSDNGGRLGANYGTNVARPGQLNTPATALDYTRGAVVGIMGRLGGQPLPVADWHWRGGRGYTPSTNWAGDFQTRPNRGVGQNYQGIAQTVQLSQITGNPPVPGDITGIIAGFG